MQGFVGVGGMDDGVTQRGLDASDRPARRWSTGEHDLSVCMHSPGIAGGDMSEGWVEGDGC